MNFYFRDEVLPYYGGGTAEARQRAGNDFMYWEVMRRAAERGCRLFDFGRSKLGTGAFAFKQNWGFEPAKLHYRYRLAPGAAIPDHNPLNPKYRLFIAAWKRCRCRSPICSARRSCAGSAEHHAGSALPGTPDPLSARQGRQDPRLEHLPSPRAHASHAPRMFRRRPRGQGASRTSCGRIARIFAASHSTVACST